MWEYKTKIIKAKTSFWGGKFAEEELNNIFNEFGKDGWELVNFATSNKAYGESGFIVAVFKKPVNS